MVNRSIDIIFSIITILFITPLLIPIIIILRFTGEGYIFYKQERIGQNSKPFTFLKFSTMLKESPKMDGGNITAKNDTRVFPFGKFLRKYKVNELPQIINVLLGDMTIIGYRPIVSEQLYFYDTEVKNIFLKRKPGLSGIASLVFRDEEKYLSYNNTTKNNKFHDEVIAPYKAELELWYFQHQSTITDLLLIIITLVSIVSPSSRLYNSFFPDLPRHPLFNPK